MLKAAAQTTRTKCPAVYRSREEILADKGSLDQTLLRLLSTLISIRPPPRPLSTRG